MKFLRMALALGIVSATACAHSRAGAVVGQLQLPDPLAEIQLGMPRANLLEARKNLRFGKISVPANGSESRAFTLQEDLFFADKNQLLHVLVEDFPDADFFSSVSYVIRNRQLIAVLFGRSFPKSGAATGFPAAANFLIRLWGPPSERTILLPRRGRQYKVLAFLWHSRSVDARATFSSDPVFPDASFDFDLRLPNKLPDDAFVSAGLNSDAVAAQFRESHLDAESLLKASNTDGAGVPR